MPSEPLPNHQKLTEHLAAERTSLAWVRTSIAVISLGFVVSKFGIWLRELAARLDPAMKAHSAGMSLPLGIGMMALGALFTALAAWHFHRVNQAIDRGEVRSNRFLVLCVTTSICLLAILMIIYMLVTGDRA